MEYNELSNSLMLELSKIYHGNMSSRLEVYYQGEMRVLTFLANCTDEEILPSDVSKALNMSSPRVSNILNSIERKGLVRRDFSTIDRRKVHVFLTNKGRQHVADSISQTYNLFYDIVKRIGEDDATELVRILNRLNTSN